MKLNAYTRLPLNPYDVFFFVLCAELIVGGVHLKFGEQLPEYIDLNHLHTHFSNGVVGTKAEVEALNAPVKLYQDNPIMPVAWFIAHPDWKGDEQVEELNPQTEDTGGNVFSLENAALMKTKDDLIGYAKEFEIELKKASNISIPKMRESLKAQALEKGLIQE
ncbi:hypothetical protein COPG_00066 [Colwellia phage 9A]|uniref:Uncharacterized protein n=1 Tax=Colwellia phage 9A TaxID=765765 RepID=I3UME7_9CAUD|nr:hypothetical protein COPG_00066 [Colwellia phage 9A]AFK66662.1 hypothetical protein COPG_00066 [Colwellia phage 9A]